MKAILAVIVFLVLRLSVCAQICTGSVGDPIVDYTFGSGPNPGPPLPAGMTNMIYDDTSLCPEDGEYLIVNYSSGCSDYSWMTLSDHTGDTDGYFMLINASYQPSTFFVDTIYGLCAGVGYQFAAWVINMDQWAGLIEPNLTFSIEAPDGTILQTDTTGNIPESAPGQWQQFKFNFNTPVGVDNVVLVISNNAPGGFGNDLALDDITFRPIGPNITVNIQGHTGSTVSFCGSVTPTPLTILATVDSCYASPEYQWQLSTDYGNTWNDINGATGLSYVASPTVGGTYQYRLAVSAGGNISNTQCRVESPVITVNIGPNPIAGITPKDTVVCVGDTVSFTASGGFTYWWSNQCNVAKNVVQVNAASAYIVTVTNSIECTATDTAFVSTFPLPVPAVTQLNTQQCSREAVQLAATGGITYVWSNGASTATITTHPVEGDTYTVTAISANNCTAADTFTVEAKIPWGISPDVFDPPCPGKNIGTIGVSISGNNGDYHYLWNTGDSTTNIDLLAPGNYSVSITDGLGCDTSFSFSLAYSYTLLVTVFPNDTIVPLNTYVYLQTTTNANNNNTYSWEPATDLTCSSCPDPMVHAVDDMYTFTVFVTDEYGCQASDSAHITTKNISAIFIPNVFTPNGDGNNNYFQIYGPGTSTAYVLNFVLKVFDRWGELVYETTDPAFKWDGTYKGKLLPPAVYAYELNYVLAGNEQGEHKMGSVTILR